MWDRRMLTVAAWENTAVVLISLSFSTEKKKKKKGKTQNKTQLITHKCATKTVCCALYKKPFCVQSVCFSAAHKALNDLEPLPYHFPHSLYNSRAVIRRWALDRNLLSWEQVSGTLPELSTTRKLVRTAPGSKACTFSNFSVFKINNIP